MMDRELLELAAKAAGICIYDYDKSNNQCWLMPDGQQPWNPITDDGDAFKLAVKLNFQVGIAPNGVEVASLCDKHYHYEGIIRRDIYAATRRAIVRAAAEIGKAMP